jgi:DNA-binding transcriptional MerR regulator
MSPAKGSAGPGREESPAPSWQDRLDDPDEPLYTVGVVAELLGLDAQALRRLETASRHTSARPSGNQRRYSRRDIQALASAAEVASQGYGGAALTRIIELERRLDEVTRPS